MTCDEILEENAWRLESTKAPYDPVKGDPMEDGRVEVTDPEGNTSFVPLSMTEDPLFLLTVSGRDNSAIRMENFHWLRCRHDFQYWAATCAYIKSKKGGADILFRLNRPQRKLVAALEKMRLASKPIRLILLKARQWGGSTCTQLYMSWIQLMHKEGLNSLIVAQQHSATAEIHEMFLRMIESYPEKMLRFSSNGYNEGNHPDEEKSGKKSRKGNRNEVSGLKRVTKAGPAALRVPLRNFKVKVGSAERPDSCRGGDYSLVHCSEVALWRKTRLRTPEDMLRAACSGVLLEPLTMILLESTANGTGNFFHTEYESAKRGESQFSNLFIPWFEIEQYSHPFSSEGERRDFARKLLDEKDEQQIVASRRQPGAYLWWLWEKGASLEAINWYVMERKKYSDHGQMASEYPSDDVEAFVHSGAKVFDRYKVEAMREGCKHESYRGEITGCSVTGPESIVGPRFKEDALGLCVVWKHPEKEPGIRITDRYLTVVDIGGRSMGSDWSVIAVFDRAPMISGYGPEIVAQWRGHTDFDILAWKAAVIAAYYQNSLLVIESNTLETHDRDRIVEGDQSLYLLDSIRRVYPNLYARKQRPDEIKAGAPLRYGFHTNVATKPVIISNLVRCIREGLYVERDEACLDEYLTYEQKPNGSYGAISGHHDDLLMTRAIGLYVCFSEMKPPRRLVSDNSGYSYRTRVAPGSAAVW